MPQQILRIKISLREIRPPIWRRVEVSSELTLAQLHTVIQTAMGWADYHLHQFQPPRPCAVAPALLAKLRHGAGQAAEKKVRVSQVFERVGAKAIYIYDFGDSWEHELVLEEAGEPEPGIDYPRCTGGRRACPPEDCGAWPGYYRLLEALAHPEDEENRELLEWCEGFAPEAFSAETVNRQLRQQFR